MNLHFDPHQYETTASVDASSGQDNQAPSTQKTDKEVSHTAEAPIKQVGKQISENTNNTDNDWKLIHKFSSKRQDSFFLSGRVILMKIRNFLINILWEKHASAMIPFEREEEVATRQRLQNLGERVNSTSKSNAEKEIVKLKLIEQTGEILGIDIYGSEASDEQMNADFLENLYKADNLHSQIDDLIYFIHSNKDKLGPGDVQSLKERIYKRVGVVKILLTHRKSVRRKRLETYFSGREDAKVQVTRMLSYLDSNELRYKLLHLEQFVSSLNEKDFAPSPTDESSSDFQPLLTQGPEDPTIISLQKSEDTNLLVYLDDLKDKLDDDSSVGITINEVLTSLSNFLDEHPELQKISTDRIIRDITRDLETIGKLNEQLQKTEQQESLQKQKNDLYTTVIANINKLIENLKGSIVDYHKKFDENLLQKQVSLDRIQKHVEQNQNGIELGTLKGIQQKTKGVMDKLTKFKDYPIYRNRHKDLDQLINQYQQFSSYLDQIIQAKSSA